MNFKTLEWKNNKLRIIDQTKLPLKLEYIDCQTAEDVWDAIKKLKVRGAPAIGIAGAFGAYLGLNALEEKEYDKFVNKSVGILKYLEECRPTAVNLKWALDVVRQLLKDSKGIDVSKIKQKILEKAIAIHEDDKERCRKIGEFGAQFIKDKSNVLTHCNAGALATGGIGTALALMYTAHEQGKKFHVYADETRPLLQGARLTAWELQKNGIDVTVICDNMSAHVLRDKNISCVVVGADRITARGDAANKIGTYGLAVLAEKHKVPFYVAAPFSTFDMELHDGKNIPIEERASEEITCGYGIRTVPDGVKVYNPAFDVTQAELITAIITEKGVIYPKFEESIKIMAHG